VSVNIFLLTNVSALIKLKDKKFKTSININSVRSHSVYLETTQVQQQVRRNKQEFTAGIVNTACHDVNQSQCGERKIFPLIGGWINCALSGVVYLQSNLRF